MKSVSIFSLIFFLGQFSSSIKAQQIYWEQTNGPSGGAMQFIFIDPADNIYLAGGGGPALQGGGVYRSIDGGMTWQPTSLLNSITKKVIKSSRGILFAATTKGIYRSSDEGLHWQKTISATSDAYIIDLVIGPDNTIFAGSLSDKLFRSTDDGESWTQIIEGFIHPVVAPIHINKRGVVFVNNYSAGLFRSSDNGNHWVQLVIEPNSPQSATSITESPTGEIFIGTNQGNIYQSTDDGDKWMKLDRTFAKTFSLTMNAQGHLFVSEYANAIIRSTDRGRSWTQLIFPLQPVDIGCIAFNSKGSMFVTANPNGIYLSEDDGHSWRQIHEGIIFTQPYALLEISNDELYAGTNWCGVFHTTNRGTNWYPVNTGIEFLSIKSLARNNKGYLFAGSYSGALFRSTDNAVSWERLTNGLASVRHSIDALVVKKNGFIFAASNYDIYKSTSDGDDWTRLNTDLIKSNIRTLIVDSIGTLYAGCPETDGIIASTDNGDYWYFANTDLTRRDVFSLVATPDGNIFAGISNQGVYRSTNSARSWQRTSLKFSNVTALTTSPDGAIIAGTEQGIFQSTNNGESWIQINEGLFNQKILTVTYTRDGSLYAGTDGSGVFRSVSRTSEVSSLIYKKQILLGQNFPNPFSDRTTVTLPLLLGEGARRAGEVSLKIFDLFGREVLDLSEQAHNATEIVIHRSQLPRAGVFFYQLSFGKHSQTKMMVAR